MRLIDADAFIQRLREASEGEDEATRELAAEIHDLVEIEATFYPIDAVKVVRCIDCKYYEGKNTYCANDRLATPDDYCSIGERREE